MEWERGPICGIDNCPSDLWRSAAGRLFCRYGHERQNEFEYDMEAEGEGGRIVAIGNAKAMKDGEVEEQKWYGPRLHALNTQIFQQILRFYANWASTELELDEDFENEVKLLWSHVLKYTPFGRSFYDIEGSGHSEACPGGSKGLLKPDIHLAVEILFVALLRVGYPISIPKFVRWIQIGKVPFAGVQSRFVPEEAHAHITGYIGTFIAVDPVDANVSTMEMRLSPLCKILEQEGITVSQPRELIFIDTVRALMLPLEMVKAANRLVSAMELGKNVNIAARDWCSNNIAIVIVVAKIAYYKSWSSYDTEIKASYWQLWSELAEIFYEDLQFSEPQDVPVWSDEKHKDFLDAYQKALTAEIDEEKVSLQQKRVDEWFPLDPVEREEPEVTVDDMARILNEQIAPFPSRAPKEIECITGEYFLQGPPLFKAVLDSASIVFGTLPKHFIKRTSAIELSVCTWLHNKSLAEKKKKARKVRVGGTSSAVSNSPISGTASDPIAIDDPITIEIDD
ncbi:hypothetical protein CJU89_5333 [Yarrowia sp. B02]|nr:hypothetical protein CJU89_5333 [Yarrowia sp. B02]